MESPTPPKQLRLRRPSWGTGKKGAEGLNRSSCTLFLVDEYLK